MAAVSPVRRSLCPGQQLEWRDYRFHNMVWSLFSPTCSFFESDFKVLLTDASMADVSLSSVLHWPAWNTLMDQLGPATPSYDHVVLSAVFHSETVRNFGN